MKMRSSTSIFFLLLPLLASSTTVPDSTSQTIVPFSTLPLCAQSCGPLFDAQGACGETAAQLTSASPKCFCSYTTLSGLSSGGTTTTCPSSNCDTADSASIVSWFNTYCASATSGSSTGTATATGTKSTSTSTSTGSATDDASSGGGSWLSSHYKYVIMIVIIVVGLAAIWIGGCFLRKRHIAKRERAYELRAPLAPWGPNTAHITPNMSQVSVFTENHGRSSSPLPQMYYAGKGRSPLSQEVPIAGAPSVTNLEQSGQNSDPYSGKRISKGKFKNKWSPADRT